MTRRAYWLLLALAILTGYFLYQRAMAPDWEQTKGPRPKPAPRGVAALQLFADGLREPVDLREAAGRIFVVEKGGRVVIVRAGKAVATPFLDVSKRVSGQSEQGLLGLAFHPKYAENGRFFVYFTDRKGDTRVIERHVSATDPDVADPDFERELLFVKQPFSNHNGGNLVFGPDGKLWIGLGDGGGAGDALGNGQKADALLGKMLRLDVDAPEKPEKPEIWAKGLRNPWRYSFDRETGDLYMGDVGQNRWEEVDVTPAAAQVPPGGNYGWNIMESFHPFEKPFADESKLVAPVAEYGHDVGLSITGGFVYRGAAIARLRGVYFYADYSTGVIRSFKYDREKKAAVDALDWTEALNPEKRAQWTSFGEDAAGEIYILSQGGEIYKLVPARF